MCSRIWVLAAWCAIVYTALATALMAAPPTVADLPLVPSAVREAMQDQDYAAAIKAIDAALAEPEAVKDYLTFLKGRALYLAKDYDGAIAAFDRFATDFPKSDYSRHVRFAKAMALARKGDFRAAETIVRAEAEYLLSAERKHQIAAIYLEFADVLFKPAKEDQKPDYAKALEFYQKAIEAGPNAEKRTEVELLIARCKQKLNDHAGAAALYEQFLKDHAGSAQEIEARYCLGESRMGEGNLKAARRAWQDLLAKFIDNPSDRVADAQFHLADTWQIPNPQSDEDLSLGVAALESFVERFPSHKLAGKAHLAIAQSYASRAGFDAATKSLKRLLSDDRLKDREEVADGQRMLGDALKMQKKYTEAIAVWQEFLAKYPAHAAWSQVQGEIVNAEYLMAIDRIAAKDYAAARKLLGDFTAKYPLDGRNPDALLLLAQTWQQEEKWDEAIAEWRRVVSKYPKTGQAAQAQLLIGDTLENKLNKLEEALEEYRKAAKGPAADGALQAIARLTDKSMVIATERVFRSDETPKIRLTTRNLESVTVRAYKVDLETWFRKMHQGRGIEGLDIALIDPDKTFEFKIPEHAKHQQVENQIEVPMPADAKTGVLAVTISSKTLEATTLVLQSDLDVIIKSSRDEVFVFAENMLTGKPWEGVRLLVSNGKQVLAEETTGKDGVWKKSFAELKDSGDVRVFAAVDGHVASNLVSLSGVGMAQGLADKGYIYTDRPAYRAGDLVHVRGCIRRAAGDIYAVDKGRKHTVDVFDPRGRLLRQEGVQLGEFGTFAVHFALPEACPQGQCRVAVRDDAGGQVYEGMFLVNEYQLEPIQLVIDLPRTVYCRGEEIEGTLRASYYYGAPLAGRELTYQLADDRQYTATTDDKGEVHFKLSTRELTESGVIALLATLPERNLRQAVQVVLAQRAFGITVKTTRPVFVAGETFETTVTTRDAEGKPIAEKVTLKVFEQTNVDGTHGERFVEEHAVETAAADGIARKTLKLAKGGQYILRAEGFDRYKNAVIGVGAVQISDEEDSVRLRILSDAHTFKAGETAKAVIHWREKPALALLAFQGAKILDYRLVELKTGENPIEIAMTPALAPNFELAVAVMADQRDAQAPKDAPKTEVKRTPVRFHEATTPFTVERALKVALSIARKGGAAGVPQPGEEVEVTVTTTDPQGKPVATELSLALVEQALLDRFASPQAAIDAFFRGVPRQLAVRTDSSITFACNPATVAINARLLAEVERVLIAEEEKESLKSATELAMDVTAKVHGVHDLVLPIRDGEADPGLAELYDDSREADFNEEMLSVDRAAIPMDTNQPYQFGDTKSWENLTGKRAKLRAYGGKSNPAKPHGGAQWGAMSSINGHMLALPEGGDGQQLGRLLKSFSESSPSAVQVVVLDKSGSMNYRTLGGEGWNEAKGEKLAEELRRSGAVLLSTFAAQETAYWNPAVVTNAEGKAVLSITLPERSTAWKLLAKGITVDTLCGESTESVVVKKDLFGQLKLPQAFTEGDEGEILATIHNGAIDKGPVEATLKTTIGGRSTEEKKTLDFTAKGIQDCAFKVSLVRPEGSKDTGVESEILFELTLTAVGKADGKSDTLRQTAALLPYGMPVFATMGGSATADTSAAIESPKDMPIERPAMQILIGPSVEQSMLDILFAPRVWRCSERISQGSANDAATSDLMAAVALQQLFAASREAGSPETQAIDGRLRSSLSALVSSQNDDGGWSWTGRGGASDRYSSARAVWAIALARKAGYASADDAFQKALAFLQNQVAATSEADYESKAVLLHALAVAGQGDFALANRLYRNRPSLSAGALVHLALAFAAMDRKPTAEELLGVLKERKLDDSASRRQTAQGSLPLNGSPAELRALSCLAWQEVNPKAPAAGELAEWLMANRSAGRWSPDKATGPAALALCRWFGATRFEGERYKLRVLVNAAEVKTLDIDATAGTQVLDVPAELLKPQAKQEVRFEITGRGRYAWQCVLGGFVPADKLKKTTDDWRVERFWQPAPLEMDGRSIPRGFGGLQGSYTAFRNPLTQLPVGGRGVVELEVWRNYSGNTPPEQLEYLVVTDPIPCGATVIEKSVQGAFERFEINPGSITFYVGNRPHGGVISYELFGYLPGKYRAGPTVVRNIHRAEQMAVAKPQELAVLPLGGKSADAYQLTPQELFELGKLYFGKKDFKAAETHLAELLAKWNCNAEIYKQAVQMLMDAYLELGPPEKAVRYFEIVKEKWPSEEIPFQKIVKVGAAYEAIGEFERSYLVFRATVESNCTRESRVAGFLESQGEFLRSVDVMGRLLREYPPEGFMASACYALAQRVGAKAPEAASDANLRKHKVNRVDLTRRGWAMLEAFLTAWPDDPAADQAAFGAANALLELKAYDEAIAACQRYAKRYPQSDLQDSFWYMVGYCHFATGRHEAALEMCRKVADTKRIDKATGRETESKNKNRAIYILGQVYHSLGRAAEAITEYRRVEGQFADAKEAIEYFTRKAIELPEVTAVATGKPAEVELKFRNVAACDVKVYRIDLMKFSLLKRDLSGITNINLSGIRPTHEETVQLGDGKDYRDRTHKLALPLKDEGAYLVVCRGDDLHRSGLVLVTPLAVEVQEDAVAGRVRTTVKDSVADKYLHNVHVKVIGSRNGDFVSGETDLRGVFTADGIQGKSTVIAQAEGSRYAFFRGSADLAPPQPESKTPAKPQAAAPNASPDAQLLEGIQGANQGFQSKQSQQLQQMYEKDQKGVEAQKAF